MVESELRSSWPTTFWKDQVIAEVNAVAMRDHRLTIWEIAGEVGNSSFSAHSIVVEALAMKRVAAKFVSKLLVLMGDQQQLHADISQDMLDSTNRCPKLINTTITGDKSWVYRYGSETARGVWVVEERLHITIPPGIDCAGVAIRLDADANIQRVAYGDVRHAAAERQRRRRAE